MGKLYVLFGAMLACAANAGTPTPFAPPASGMLVLYRHATLIDGTTWPDTDVLVDGERIRSIGPSGTLAEDKAKIIDLSGRFLMPGLIDSHVHLATPPNRRQAEAVLRRDLYGGVTAVRDMADDLRALADITRAARVGESAGADVYYAALMAGPDFFASDPRTGMTSLGWTNGTAPWMRAVTPETDLHLAVAEAHGTGATAIKLYADLTADLAAKITAEAHRQHMLVWAHATLFPARPSEVVAAGVDAISHACLVAREATPYVPRITEKRPPVPLEQFKDGRNPALAKLFAEMKRRGTIFDATVWTYTPGPASAVTPQLVPGGCDDVTGGAITGQAWRAGVAISAGTDAVAPWDDPWPDLFHELDDMVTKAHMPPAAVMQSATLISARAAGQERDMGSLAPGKLANMIVLTKNPLADLAALKTVEMTIKRGRIFRRSDFVPLAKDDITDQ